MKTSDYLLLGLTVAQGAIAKGILAGLKNTNPIIYKGYLVCEALWIGVVMVIFTRCFWDY